MATHMAEGASSSHGATERCCEHLPPLTAVALVCATHDGFSTLAAEISPFIDPAATRRWTVEAASERGDVRLLQRVLAHEPLRRGALYDSFVFSRALVHAVQHDNDIALLECLHAFCPSGFASDGMEAAAASGKAHVIEWISAHCSNIIWSARFLNQAAHVGSLPVLQWLYAKLEVFPNRLATVIATAIDHRHFDAAQWLLRAAHRDGAGVAFHTASIFRAACRAGHLETLVVLLTDLQYTPLAPPLLSPTDLLVCAVMSGNLVLVDWLYDHQHFSKWSSNAYALAAQRGHVDVLRRLLAHADTSAKTLHSSLRDAVRVATLSVLKLLHELVPEVLSGSLLAEKTPSAAESGDVAMLAWLLPRIEAGATSFAATVRYHYAAIVVAASNGHVAVVEWLVAHVRPHVPNPTQLDRLAVSEAAASGHAALAKWIHTHLAGHTRPSYNIVSLAERGRLNLIQWMLVTERAACASDPTATLEAAARSGDLETLLFLHAHRCEGCTLQAAVDAHDAQHLVVLQWLVETFPDVMSIQEIETRMRWAWGPDLRYWSPLLTRLGLSDVMTVR